TSRTRRAASAGAGKRKAMQMQEEGAHTFPTYKALLNAVVAELYDHEWFYAAFMPENWENQLSAYYYEGAFNCDIEQHQSYHENLETWTACPNEVLTSKARVERIHSSPPGPTGEAGLIGEPGPEGALGDNEKKGAKIQPGPSGDQGPQGGDGDQGAQGPKGEPGQAATGVKGEKGDQGADGDVGNRDPQGHKGERGVDGSPGSPGDPSPSVERGKFLYH
ncbi:unnamed protein product, partial [Porites lobata]